MSRISRSVLQEIIHKTDMTGVLSQFLHLRPQGRKFLALCPFHNEKTPSFTFDPETGLFHCFGCKAGGDFIRLLMQLEGLTFAETVRELGRRAGIEVEEISPEERAHHDRKQRLREIVEHGANLYHRLLLDLPGAQQAREYLGKRGLSPDTIEQFQLGYAPTGPFYLVERLRHAGHDVGDLVAAGLAVDRNGRVFDMFRDRVTFPIRDLHGQAVAMGARLMGEGQPKYLNSPETELFSKRSNLYGLFQARTALRSTPAIVVEGYMDVIAMHQGGFPQTVASLGTALTSQQSQLLRRYCEGCVLAYDADTAGEHATERGIEVFEEARLSVRVMRMPPGEDPDSLLRTAGPEAIRTHLDAALGIVEYRMQTLAERLNLTVPDGKSRYVREMLPTLGRIRDIVRRDEYIRLVSGKAGVSESAIRQMLRIDVPLSATEISLQQASHPTQRAFGPSGSNSSGKGSWVRGGESGQRNSTYPDRRGEGFGGGMRNERRRYQPTPPPLAAPGSTASEAAHQAENKLLRYLLQHPEAMAGVRDAISLDDIDDAVVRAALNWLLANPDRQTSPCAADLVPLLDDPTTGNEPPPRQAGVDRRLSELLLAENAEPQTPELFAGLLKSFQIRRDKAELDRLRKRMKARLPSSSDDPDYMRLSELQQRLQND